MVKRIFDKRNVLVVGGAGFIGSHLCDELVKTVKVICVDNFLTGSERNIDHLLKNPDFEFIKHDITQPFQLNPDEVGLAKFKAAWQGVQQIYFLASPSSRGDVDKYPVETMMVNSVGLKHALDLAVENDAVLSYISSGAVYGLPLNAESGKVKESVEGIVRHIDNHSAYVVAQRFGEGMVETYRRNRNLNVRVARVFSSYGPRMKLSGTRLIAQFTRKALNNEEIVIYGGSEAVASYCYVDDTVKGLIQLMEHGDEQPVNIGSDEQLKLVDLAHDIVKRVSSESGVVLIPDIPDGYRTQLVPDITRAKEQLGWFPVTRLEDGLTRTMEDLKASKGLVDIQTATS